MLEDYVEEIFLVHTKLLPEINVPLLLEHLFADNKKIL